MIIITGGAGFIGSAILWKLNELGEKNVLIVDQNLGDSPKKSNLEKLRYTQYLDSETFIQELERGVFNQKTEAILHMGACSSTTETDTAFLRENNSRFSERLASWALKENVYFSYASSAAAYGAGEKSYSDEDRITPFLKPLNPYGQSKLDFDVWVVRNILQYRITGFRFFNVYGPNEYHKGDMRSMVHKGFEQIQSTGKLRLFKSYKREYPDGGQKRDFIYVKDAVDVVLWFYQNKDKKGIYNVGAGRAQTWNELAKALFKSCGKKETIEYFDMPPNIKDQYQYFTEADLTKLRKAGYTRSFRNLDSGVADYVQNYLTKDNPYL